MDQYEHERKRLDLRAAFVARFGLSQVDAETLAKVVEEFNSTTQMAFSAFESNEGSEDDKFKAVDDAVAAATTAAAASITDITGGRASELDVMKLLGPQMDMTTVATRARYSDRYGLRLRKLYSSVVSGSSNEQD